MSRAIRKLKLKFPKPPGIQKSISIFNIIKYEHISDAPVDSQGGYGIVEKLFAPSKIALPLHRFIKEFQEKKNSRPIIIP